MAQNTNSKTTVESYLRELELDYYYKKLSEMANKYGEGCLAKIFNTQAIQYKIQNSYSYSGVKIKQSDLSSIVSDYIAFSLCKLKETQTFDQMPLDSEDRYTTINSIDKYTTIIEQNGCKDVMNSRSIKSGECSEHELTCLKAYGKLYAEAMYIGASAHWETPVGCCKVIIVDEDGASLGNYR